MTSQRISFRTLPSYVTVETLKSLVQRFYELNSKVGSVNLQYKLTPRNLASVYSDGNPKVVANASMKENIGPTLEIQSPIDDNKENVFSP